MLASAEVGELDAVCKKRRQARVLDVVLVVLDVHQVVSDAEESSFGLGFRAYDEHHDELALHVLLWTAGDDRAAGDLRGHCARLVEPALGAEHARAPRSGPPPDLQFHFRDEADDTHDDVVPPVLVRSGLWRGLGVDDCGVYWTLFVS